MKAFVVAGPESSCNRLVTALLTRAGVIGDASTDQRFDVATPDGSIGPVVVLRSVPHGKDHEPALAALIYRLQARGYDVTLIVNVRDRYAAACSQVARGHARDFEEAARSIDRAYGHIVREIADVCRQHDVAVRWLSVESLVLTGRAAVGRFLLSLGLDPVTEGALRINGEDVDGIEDPNAKHYAGG